MTIQIKEVNCTSGEEIVRDATAAEIAEIETRQAEVTAKEAEAEAKEVTRQAILNRLGISAEELKTILG